MTFPKTIRVERGVLVDHSVLVDCAGVRRLWQRIKAAADIEAAIAAHEAESVHLVEVVMTPEDYDAYVANQFKGERIVLSGNSGPATQYLWREQVDRTGGPHIFPAEVHATPPPPAKCDDCGAGDQSLISKGDHHGGTKIVCADRAACHVRGG